MPTIFRNPQKLETSKVIEEYKKSLKNSKTFTKDEVEALSENFAKNPTDIFIVSEDGLTDTFSVQGDILIWREGSTMYEKEIKNIQKLEKTDRLVLQEGDSMTGDHRLIPVEGSKFTLKKGTYTPSFLKGKNAWGDRTYECRLLEINKPFLIFHREHGNMTLPSGKYMICSQMDSSTLERMMD